MNSKSSNSLTRSISRIALGTAFILLIPFLAMQFSDEVKWDRTDFITIGVLLFGAGILYELLSRKVEKKYRIIIGIVIVAAVSIIWIDLAVGIFNIPGFSGS